MVSGDYFELARYNKIYNKVKLSTASFVKDYP
jgi:hypothetical protein